MERGTYHNHEPWTGPCSDDRHKLIVAGGPADRAGATPTTAKARAEYLLSWTVHEEDGALYCRCCKAQLAAAAEASAAIATASAAQ